MDAIKVNWLSLDEGDFYSYREDYLTLSSKISTLMSSIEEKENEILSISDRLIELLAEKNSPENKAQYARAREKRARLRDECVLLKALVREGEDEKEWIKIQVKIKFSIVRKLKTQGD